MDGAAAVGIALWIEAKENLHSFAPIGAITLGIEQAHVELHVLAIIGCQRLAGRSVCRDMSVSRGPSFAHVRVTYLLTIFGGR